MVYLEEKPQGCGNQSYLIKIEYGNWPSHPHKAGGT